MRIILFVTSLIFMSGCGPDRWESGNVTLTCNEFVIIEGADWVNYPTRSNGIHFGKGGKDGFYRIKGGETCYVEDAD